MTTHLDRIPELLLPAGNMDNFNAAVKGGADAVYLGVKSFNARGRAKNFTYAQLSEALQIAKKLDVKIYVTLNTVIKNNEIPDLIETLYNLDQLSPDAIIIQDYGVFQIAKKHFPNLKLHASTQMAIHNTQGVNYTGKLGFERVILARELTLPEIKTIAAKAKTEIELFIHGALCYSFSGLCLYSSYMGGQGANRGLCKQPCRRIFHQSGKNEFPFNLKDLQTLELIPELRKLNIHSLKVEGRLKSANYTHNVAKAYKMALENTENLKKARQILEMDLGRDKTSYFIGGKVTDAISDRTATGKEIGKIVKVHQNQITITSNITLNKGDRLRFVHRDGSQTAYKIHDFNAENDLYIINLPETEKLENNNKIYLASQKDPKISFEEHVDNKLRLKPINNAIKNKILSELKVQTDKKQKKFIDFYVRINNLNWIKKVQFNDIFGLFIQLPLNQHDSLKTDVPFIQKNLHKIYFELPAFIPEDAIQDWQKNIIKLKKRGIKQFVISHLSQQKFFNPKDRIICNENIYLFNNAAIKAIKDTGVSKYTYPLENDLENIKAYINKDGIQPVYFRPRLFYSRMPVKIDTNHIFKDDYNTELSYVKSDNLNHIYPEIPVSFSHHVETFKEMGITSFLIDFSFEKPSQNRWKSIIKKAKKSEQIQPASSFNLKLGLT